ncbi:MAG: hypothetical protein ACE5IA_04615 [Dehalococcoidia bacterium]
MGRFLDRAWWRHHRLLIHIPAGVLIVEAAFQHWTLPLCLTALFVFYERNEDHWIRDQAWKDVVGALWGMALDILARRLVTLL